MKRISHYILAFFIISIKVCYGSHIHLPEYLGEEFKHFLSCVYRDGNYLRQGGNIENDEELKNEVKYFNEKYKDIPIKLNSLKYSLDLIYQHFYDFSEKIQDEYNLILLPPSDNILEEIEEFQGRDLSIRDNLTVPRLLVFLEHRSNALSTIKDFIENLEKNCIPGIKKQIEFFGAIYCKENTALDSCLESATGEIKDLLLLFSSVGDRMLGTYRIYFERFAPLVYHKQDIKVVTYDAQEMGRVVMLVSLNLRKNDFLNNFQEIQDTLVEEFIKIPFRDRTQPQIIQIEFVDIKIPSILDVEILENKPHYLHSCPAKSDNTIVCFQNHSPLYVKKMRKLHNKELILHEEKIRCIKEKIEMFYGNIVSLSDFLIQKSLVPNRSDILKIGFKNEMLIFED